MLCFFILGRGGSGCSPDKSQFAINSEVYNPGGFTLHMTGYAPACTKSVEKGSFLDKRQRRRLLQKMVYFSLLIAI